MTLHTRRFCVGNEPGTTIEVSWRVPLGGRGVETDTQTTPLRPDCTVAFRLSGFTVSAKSYTATFELQDPHDEDRTRRLTIRGV